jgi:protein-L-isoaspartate(D-aspartate) O-methyltransferase
MAVGADRGSRYEAASSAAPEALSRALSNDPLELQVYYRHITAMTIQTPIPDFAAARVAMIDSQLRPQGVTDRGVLEAMGSIAREKFLPPHTRPLAYVDRAVAMGEGRFLPAPAVLGQLLNQMMPHSGQRALVVGAGTGYSAAVLAAIGVSVTAVESAPELAAAARSLGVKIIEGPLEAGHAKGAPYDLVLIDGAVEYIPDTLVDQLADGGTLGTALVERGVTRLVVGRKVGGAFGYLTIGDAGAPLLRGFTCPPAVRF